MALADYQKLQGSDRVVCPTTHACSEGVKDSIKTWVQKEACDCRDIWLGIFGQADCWSRLLVRRNLSKYCDKRKLKKLFDFFDEQHSDTKIAKTNC